jgi:hypothetical protein
LAQHSYFKKQSNLKRSGRSLVGTGSESFDRRPRAIDLSAHVRTVGMGCALAVNLSQ